MASMTPNWSTGDIQAPDVGKTLIDFSKQQADYADRMLQRQQLLESQRRWEIENKRAQTLADRQTEEFEREKTLRGVRKDIASEFTSSPYAAKWGTDKVTSTLDKLVNQEAERRLAAGEAPFSEEEASQLQAYYETARPYKEDAVNAIAASLVAQGEDAVKAKQEAEVLASGTLLSKADQQARLDAQQKMYQDFYGSQAKANLDAAKLNQDYDIARMKMYGGTGSGGSGSGGSGFAGTTMLKPQETIEKWDIGPLDSKEAMGLVNTASTMGYSPWQIQKALENSINLDVGGVISDKKVVEDKFKENLLKMAPGQMPGSTGGGYSASSFMPQFAPRQIAGYDPEGFAKEALRQMPWLDRSRPAESGKNTSGGGTGYKATVANTEAPNYTAVNKTSGAMGQYQFLNSTLNDYRDKFGGFTNEQFLNNPRLQDQVFDAYTKDNEAFLKSKGVEVTDWTRWLAHNLGIANVKPFLEGRMTEGVEKAIKANLPGQTPSIDNYIDKYAKRFNAQDLAATISPENVNPKASAEKSRNYAKAQELMTPSEKSEFMKLVDAGNVEGVNKYTKEILDRGPTPAGPDYTTMKLPEMVSTGYDELSQWLRDNQAKAPLQGQEAVDAMKGNRTPEEYKKYLDWANREDPGITPIIQGFNSATTEDNARVFLRQQEIAAKYNDNPNTLTASEKRWIAESRLTPNGRRLLEMLGID